MKRRHFIRAGSIAIGSSLVGVTPAIGLSTADIDIPSVRKGENVFEYIRRTSGGNDWTLYRQIIGACNPYKEGDDAIGVAADSDKTRENAQALLANTRIDDLVSQPLFSDELYRLIENSTDKQILGEIKRWTIGDLKAFILTAPESEIHRLMPGLPSDIIACVVKLMSNEELITVGQKIFNPLPGSQIGAKGYMSARVQPNSPTDNTDDVIWQVFSAWSYGVGDLVLGTNPVSSQPESVARIEAALFDIIQTFGLEHIIPNCVLAHIDVQAEVEQIQPGTTGIWFQSLAGTDGANATFDLTIDKMLRHARSRNGRYGLYFETGQGADFTNGHGEGFDMVVHEARKYGFARALKIEIGKTYNIDPWVHLNDVAGFIGPEVFKTKEQLVRTCLEDTAMGKLHGLPIGLDICSTLHMDVSLGDLDWCIEQIMPANPAYLMALPTKNDPMLSYLTTAYSDHVRVREKFNYKVNDAMWDFFKSINIINTNNEPTEHFGDPLWVYYQYRLRKNDLRTKEEIFREGRAKISEIENRGVPIASGYGEHYWDLPAELDKEVRRLYLDAKKSIWTEMSPAFIASIPNRIEIASRSTDRVDYIYHPESGEKVNNSSNISLKQYRATWDQTPDVQIIISDGLNARALMDDSHLNTLLPLLREQLTLADLSVADKNILMTNGRVRAGYQCGELLFGNQTNPENACGVIHLIGERPGSGHHNFSAYITAAKSGTWANTGKVDHDITKVVSGISDTALKPEEAVPQIVGLFVGLMERLV